MTSCKFMFYYPSGTIVVYRNSLRTISPTLSTRSNWTVKGFMSHTLPDCLMWYRVHDWPTVGCRRLVRTEPVLVISCSGESSYTLRLVTTTDTWVGRSTFDTLLIGFLVPHPLRSVSKSTPVRCTEGQMLSVSFSFLPVRFDVVFVWLVILRRLKYVMDHFLLLLWRPFVLTTTCLFCRYYFYTLSSTTVCSVTSDSSLDSFSKFVFHLWLGFTENGSFLSKSLIIPRIFKSV